MDYPARDPKSAMLDFSQMMADPLKAPPVGKPDFNAVATNIHRIRDVYPVKANAAGEYWGLAIGGHANGFYNAPTIVDGVVTSLGTPTSSSYTPSLSADNTKYRPLAYVVEWEPTFSTNDSQGRVFMGTYNAPVTLQSISSYFDELGLTAPAKERAVAIARPFSELLPVGINVAGPSEIGQTVIAMSGLPPLGDCGQLIITRILECYPLGHVLAAMAATHTPCNMADCCTAANIVGPAVSYASGPGAYEGLVKTAKLIMQAAIRAGLAYNSGGMSELKRLVGM